MFEGIFLIFLLLAVVAAVVAVTQAQRKIPVQHAQRAVGRKVYAGGSSFMPLRVNYSASWWDQRQSIAAARTFPKPSAGPAVDLPRCRL